MTTYLSQYDQRWTDKKIGMSELKLGRWGCTITSLSMSLHDFGFQILPDEIANQKAPFTKGGLVVWGEMQKWLQSRIPDLEVSLRRYYGRNDDAIKANLVPGSGVLLEVANGAHWIKADRKQWLRNDYSCRDPWGGVARSAVGDYKNITGFAVLKMK